MQINRTLGNLKIFFIRLDSLCLRKLCSWTRRKNHCSTRKTSVILHRCKLMNHQRKQWRIGNLETRLHNISTCTYIHFIWSLKFSASCQIKLELPSSIIKIISAQLAPTTNVHKTMYQNYRQRSQRRILGNV